MEITDKEAQNNSEQFRTVFETVAVSMVFKGLKISLEQMFES